MLARLARTLSVCVLAFIAACGGSKLDFGRGYSLTHDEQRLTVTFPTVLPNSCIVDCVKSDTRAFMIVRNDGKKPFSLLAIVEHGTEVSLSGNVTRHLWVRFSELPSPASTELQDKVASTAEADFDTVQRPKRYTSTRSYFAVELGAKQERLFELLESPSYSASIKLHLDWK
jgi:hypothetical protein